MQEQNKHMRVADEPLYSLLMKNRNVELTKRGEEFLANGESDHNFFVIPDLAQSLHQIEINPNITKEETTQQKEKY